MKTAMMDLLDFSNTECNPNELIDKAISLLKKEQKQIANAFEKGKYGLGKSGEKYYNETFTQPIETKD